ncbi:MAG: phage regulatory protein/antirepressor Ant [Campylobacter sp.]|nr:phage regulatory protein/antirepressor Ant [Campylobacter sp.]
MSLEIFKNNDYENGERTLINNREITLEIENNEVLTTSLQIAEVFEKRHDNVLAKIEELPDDDFRRLNFKASHEPRQNGLFVKDTKHYKITRDGFVMLVMSFTGERAYEWKKQYINAFNLMEAKLRVKAPSTMKEALLLALEQQERLEALESKNKELKAIELINMPYVSFAKSVEASIDGVLIGNYAKLLSDSEGVKIGQNALFAWLRDKGYLISGGARHNVPYQKYIDNGYFEVTTQTFAGSSGTHQKFTTKITGKAQIALANKIVEAFKE